MPKTTFPSFPLNLSLLLENENNRCLPVAEGTTLPQQAIEEWIAENATDLDREADRIFQGFDALASLPESERSKRSTDLYDALVELSKKGSALAARHAAAHDLSGLCGLDPHGAANMAEKAVKLGCEPARHEYLKACARLVTEDTDAFFKACRESLGRDECVLFMAELLHSDILSESGLTGDILLSLYRQALEGSVDALRLLFLAILGGRVSSMDMAREVYDLLKERAKTDIFCARLLAQYELGLLFVAPGVCLDGKDRHPLDGLLERLSGPRIDDFKGPHALEKIVASLHNTFAHALSLPAGWAQKRGFFVHAAGLGDPWSELVLDVYDAMWEDCPHDAMAALRELAERKNYPPARTLLAALRFNEIWAAGRDEDGEGADDGEGGESGQGEDVSSELDRIGVELKEAALAMPEDARLERLWLDCELQRSLACQCEEPDHVWGLTSEESLRFDPDDPADPLYWKAVPETHFLRNVGTPEQPSWWGQIDFLADLPTNNPHLAAIRDRAVANSPYAAFLLGRAIINGAFGDSIEGKNGGLLLMVCLDFAMSRDVEEAVVFCWAQAVAHMNGLYPYGDIDWYFQYHMLKYRSLARLLLLSQHLGMWKWYLRLLHGLTPSLDDSGVEEDLLKLVGQSHLAFEPVGMFLMALKRFDTILIEDYVSEKEMLARKRPPSTDKVLEHMRLKRELKDGVAKCFMDSIEQALDLHDLPTLLLVLAALHQAAREKMLEPDEKRMLAGFFGAVGGVDVSEMAADTTLDELEKKLIGRLEYLGSEMKSIRKYFDHFETAEEAGGRNAGASRERTKERARRQARKRQRQRARKGKK